MVKSSPPKRKAPPSGNSGASFTALNGSAGAVLPSGVPFQTVVVDPVNPNHLRAGTQGYDLGLGSDVPSLYQSTDGGVHWAAVLTVPP